MIPLRDENPTIHPPVLTIVLIALNVLVFLWQIGGGEIEKLRRDFMFSAVPYNLTQGGDGEVFRFVGEVNGRMVVGQGTTDHPDFRRAVDDEKYVLQPVPAWVTVITSMFLHGGWMHLIGNMLFLWVFGNNIEDALGKPRFLLFYLVTGAAASAGHIFSNPESMVPTLGASGAVSGILGGYLLLYPKSRVLTIVPLGYILTTLHLPAFVFLGVWFLMQISGVLGADAGVAWWAHIGGFVVGLVLVKLFETREHRGRAEIVRPEIIRRHPGFGPRNRRW